MDVVGHREERQQVELSADNVADRLVIRFPMLFYPLSFCLEIRVGLRLYFIIVALDSCIGLPVLFRAFRSNTLSPSRL